MPNNYFSLTDSRQASQDGHFLLSATETATEILRGMVAHATFAGGTATIKCKESTDLPVGLFYDYMSHASIAELSTANGRNLVQLKGKPVTYVYGRFRALAGDGLFEGAVTIGGAIYGDDATGKLTTDTDGGDNSVKIGRVLQEIEVTDVDGDLYLCEFDFPVA